jgi:hypothetical protein
VSSKQEGEKRWHPHLADQMDPKAMPFDSKRMIYGGLLHASRENLSRAPLRRPHAELMAPLEETPKLAEAVQRD